MTGDIPSRVPGVRFTTVEVYGRRRAKPVPLALSPTAIAAFLQCRHLYKLAYIDRLRDQYARPRPYYTMANHVHATLKDFLTLLPLERRTPEAIEDLLRSNWQRYRIGFRDRQDEKRWAEKALAQLRAFVLNHDVSAKPLMVEESLQAEITPGLILRGRVDRVDRESDGCLHIIDYKTGGLPHDIDWMQLQLHALILSRRLPWPVRRLSYLYLGPSILESTEISPGDLDRARWDLLGLARKVRREKRYSPSQGPWCSGCDFRSICPKGDVLQPAAGTEGQLELWDDLTDE